MDLQEFSAAEGVIIPDDLSTGYLHEAWHNEHVLTAL